MLTERVDQIKRWFRKARQEFSGITSDFKQRLSGSTWARKAEDFLRFDRRCFNWRGHVEPRQRRKNNHWAVSRFPERLFAANIRENDKKIQAEEPVTWPRWKWILLEHNYNVTTKPDCRVKDQFEITWRDGEKTSNYLENRRLPKL
jgi:hypothetical protein